MLLRMNLRALVTALMISAFVLSAAAQPQVIRLWPGGTPEPPQTSAAEANVATAAESARAGYAEQRITNVTVPTLTVYPAPGSTSDGRNATHAAALVFPGGGYMRLAMDIEGTQTCQWLNSVGVTCLLVKYRVPEAGVYPANFADLEDAQQAMRIARAHSGEWHLDPARIGVVGFSAGGNLAVLLSTHADDTHVMSTPAANQVPLGTNGRVVDARANFAVVVYPAYLSTDEEHRRLDATYLPDALTPPTFLLQAEDDTSYGFNAFVYGRALRDAGVPVEMHIYATGGHGFGTFPPSTKPEHDWTALATTWLRGIGMLQ
jgi:acetyl esterase/lipase